MKSNLHQTFIIYQVWSTKLLKIFQASAPTWVHAQHMKPCKLILCFFCNFFIFFILNSFLTENEKNSGQASFRYRSDINFLFYAFFPFQSGSPPKGSKWVQKWSKYHIFTPGGQNMKLSETNY